MNRELREQIKALANKIIANEKSFSVVELKIATKELYDRLVVLQYLESQLNESQDSANTSLDSKSYREENWFVEPEPLPTPEHKDELIEPVMEKIKDLVAQMPEESQQVDELLEEVLPPKKLTKNDLEEFASEYQQMPTFERKQEDVDVVVQNNSLENKKSRSINEQNHKGLNIGLNDRIAFIKHLFNDSAEDYSRVLSQISSMGTFEQASKFIVGQVKPDYNNWLEKDEFSDRFMDIIERSFN